MHSRTIIIIQLYITTQSQPKDPWNEPLTPDYVRTMVQLYRIPMSPIQNPIPDSYNDMGAAALVNQSKTNYVIILYGYISYDETIQGLEKKKREIERGWRGVGGSEPKM